MLANFFNLFIIDALNVQLYGYLFFRLMMLENEKVVVL